MAVTFINSITGSSSVTGSSGFNISLSGLTLLSGDYLVVNICCGTLTSSITYSCNGNNGGSGNSTAIKTNNYASATNDTNQGVFVIRQGSTVDTNVFFSTGDATSQPYVWTISQYRSVSSNSPTNGSTALTGTLTDHCNPGAVTPTIDGAMIVVLYSASQSVSTAWTAPTDVTDFVQAAASSKGRVGFGNKAWTSGTFDPAALSGGDSSPGKGGNTWAAVTLVLAPGNGNRFGVWF